MSAYFVNNSNKKTNLPFTNPTASTEFFDSKKKAFLAIVLVLCLLPSLLNVVGFDFTSNTTSLNTNQVIEANHLFYALA